MAHEERREFDGALGDEPGVGRVEQPGVLLRQREGGGRVGADDAVALADEVGEGADVGGGGRAGGVGVPLHERGHAAAPLPPRDVDLEAVVPQDGDGGEADRRVVEVGEQVDEVGDLLGPADGGVGPGLGAADRRGGRSA